MLKGIDVSDWQGKINFEKVKADGIKCIIVRYADGNVLDDKFENNMMECEKHGFHFGAYIYSRATNKSEAKKEAQRLIKACKKYNYDMPLYIDIESSQNKKDPNGVIDGFLEICDKNKINGGIYANLDWFLNKINIKKYLNRPLWLAQYYKEITDINPDWFGMWQFTSSGIVDGIRTPVDLNEVYVYYWEDKIKEFPNNIKIMTVDTLLGKYGNGKNRIEKLGKYYNDVQSLVNILIEKMR